MIRKFYRLLKSEEIPRDRDSQEFKDFWKEERRRCKDGMYIGDVFISGLLYYFWNHYWMRIDKPDGSFEYTRPWMREVEIMSIGDYVKCLEERICYTLFGTRQSGKTEVMCAITQWYYGIHKNTRSLILYPIEDKWKSFEEKLKESVKAALLDNPDNACIPHYIDADWNKKEIRWGVQKSDADTIISAITYKNNTKEGKYIEASASKTINHFLMDEIAVSPFLAVWRNAVPTLKGNDGRFRGAPFFAFTGGDAKNAHDAKVWVYDISPKEKFYTELESGQKISGRFLDVTYRKDLVRKKIKFEEYFGKTDIDWFDELEIYTRDIEYANVVLEEEHKTASESGDETAISGYLMANPRTVEHTFLVEGQSWFDNNEIEACQSNLRENYTPLLVTLHNTSDRKVSWRNSTLKPIQKFPVRATDNKLAPVEIYEPPIEGAPRYTYVLGIDPLTSEESNDKIVSLGSACVYKRMLNPLDEFKDTVVASYSGRPEKLVEFHEVCLMLAKMYNCEYTTLPEYSESSLIQYFQRTGNTHYLCPSLELTKYIQKNSHQQGTYGLKPTVKNIEHYMALMKDRMKGDSYTVDGLEYITGDSGMKNIRWYMLLEEMKHYKSAGKGRGHGLNVDRIVAYGHALVMADWLDIQYGKLYNSKKFDSPKEEVYVPKSQGVFLGRGNMSFGGNRSVFR